MDNSAYLTDEIVRYFSSNRLRWDQFYESERVVIDKLALDSNATVLDIGCGCGGLGLALQEHCDIQNYTGIELNQKAVNFGRELNPQADLLCGDVLDLTKEALIGRQFDVVFSLSCVDWNVRFSDMLQTSWDHVGPGGWLVATFRLCISEGIDDIDRSYQVLNSSNSPSGPRVSYVVLNASDLIRTLAAFDPARVHSHGYWGTPSPSAVTRDAQLCFAAFAVQKRSGTDTAPTLFGLDLPIDLLKSLGNLLASEAPFRVK